MTIPDEPREYRSRLRRAVSVLNEVIHEELPIGKVRIGRIEISHYLGYVIYVILPLTILDSFVVMKRTERGTYIEKPILLPPYS